MIELSKKEKDLILAAIQIEKENQDQDDSEEFKEMEDLEAEITRENVFLSRPQIDCVIYYLGALFQNSDYEQSDVIALDAKLEELSHLP
ncbi:hypothetical protein [Chryseobacterium profundimaris]|uniref:Uncharacterized protein n=1 Tax=Chryseobacterium profundimaris TaxID=1387275 RepID=A0ABY1NT67_9FLAO|nr:hypothetical protein [Chryseobacterium profundimaris]SMP16398.1 hypothetical protein SAMN06264346_10426 [Chryseobacterium profundimaris]